MVYILIMGSFMGAYNKLCVKQVSFYYHELYNHLSCRNSLSLFPLKLIRRKNVAQGGTRNEVKAATTGTITY